MSGDLLSHIKLGRSCIFAELPIPVKMGRIYMSSDLLLPVQVGRMLTPGTPDASPK
jgi:hypothetical protein